LNEAGLYEYGVNSLSRQMRSVADLRRLMTRRVEPGELGEAAVSRRRWPGCTSTATWTTQDLPRPTPGCARRTKSWAAQSPAGSCSKRASTELIAETLEARYGQTNEEALAREHLERKRMRKPENEKETARVMRRLVTAGFSTGVIYKILRQWDVPDESLAALDNLDE
jgi:regulatory protein